ncbi:MAG: phosphoglycerate dehydrogenase, partial [Bacteroidetes bacterium]|nr:phosphoglycerate dehydrogenase [Bacteroidota bacterium]
MAPKVLVTSRTYQMNPTAIEALHRTGYDITMMKPEDAAQTDKLIAAVPGHDAMLAGAEPITPAVLEAAQGLKIVSRTGIGVENVDLPTATKKGIVVTFTPGANHDAVADFVLTLMLELARRAWYGYDIMRAGKWGPYQGIELPGKTMGIVGFGRIGKEVARRAHGFRMEILANDVVRDHEFARQVGATFVSLEELLRRSDFVSLNCFQSPETMGMVNRSTIALMKPTAFLINTARGGLVNEADLLAALREKRIAGAALDVFSREPTYDTPFAKLDNCIVTPHQAGYTYSPCSIPS